MEDKTKKAYKIAVIALVIALLALGTIQSLVSVNTTTGVIFEVNNTNLAPNVAGHPPGTGERIQNVTYWANNSPIQLMVFAHASSASSALAVNLSINNVSVEQIHLRPIGAGENTHAYVTAIIPMGANYSVNITNFHHYEWREYRVLTGNVSINITNSSGSGGTCTNCINETQLIDNMSLKVNKSGHEYISSNISLQNNLTILTDQTNRYLEEFVKSTSIVVPPQNAGLNLIQQDAFGSFSMFGFANATIGSTFGGHMSRYNSTTKTLYPLLNGDAPFFFFMKGWDGSSWSISRARFFMETAGNWNTTSHPARIRMLTTNVSDTSFSTIFEASGNMTIEKPGGGITMSSPNGNKWCTTVTNAGTLNTAAGACI